jgi:small basic protein (TIGR04137 family)
VSLDKSLKRTDMLQRRRNVLTRAERIKRLVEDERFDAGAAIAIVAPKGPAKEEKAEGEAAEGAEQKPAQ